MALKVVEFICDENTATPGTLPTPRPADRPRPSAADLKTRQAGVQSFDAGTEPNPGQTPIKHDVTT
jgi:hypothetical protein